jgi:hypothetical protein
VDFPVEGRFMAAISVALDEPVATPDRATAAPRSRAKIPDAEELRRREYERMVLLHLGFCGALINRDAIEFAKGIVELLVWSAEHARSAAEARLAVAGADLADWRCRGCGELVPGNFELCWQCEQVRPQ